MGMTPHKRTGILLASILALVAAAVLAAKHRPRPQAEPRPVAAAPPPAADDRKIQVALLLDTSGSMDGLLGQAKSQLWKVVNELARARLDGRPPRLEIALYEYGKSSLPAESGYLRRISPFTTDLDRISEELFALATNGGDEYCGQVIQRAVEDLAWSDRPGDLKVIFIAGNEPFNQGPVAPEIALGAAVRKGITVNTILCGGVDDTWQHAAAFAHGGFMTIDQNQAVVHIAAPQDDEIARLGVALNGTYIAYGAHGLASAERQKAQDANAQAAAPGSLMQRSLSKASGLYRNSTWDLVDGLKDGTVDLAKVAEADLPEEMRKMSASERRAYVADKQAERARLQQKIMTLNAEREKFVQAELAKQGLAADHSLDAALLKLVHQQAAGGGWRFE